MAALPPASFTYAAPVGGLIPTDHVAATWTHIVAEARRLTAMARIGPDDGAGPMIADLIARAGAEQRALAAQGIEDIAAMLDAGMAALETLAARGQDASAPALALWVEYHAARSAIASILGAPAGN